MFGGGAVGMPTDGHVGDGDAATGEGTFADGRGIPPDSGDRDGGAKAAAAASPGSVAFGRPPSIAAISAWKMPASGLTPLGSAADPADGDSSAEGAIAFAPRTCGKCRLRI